jgi:SNF family Na+-dependent transporter
VRYLHGIFFVLHIVAALASAVVVVVMVSEARAQTSSRQGRNVAARVLHLLPLTGAAIIASSQGSLRWSEWWVSLGMALYVVAAYCLEAVALPAERRLAKGERDASRTLERSLYVVVSLLIVALGVMTFHG